MLPHELFEYPLRTNFCVYIILAIVVLFVTISEFNICWVDVVEQMFLGQRLKIDRNMLLTTLLFT